MSFSIKEINDNIEIKEDNSTFLEIKTYHISRELEDIVQEALEKILEVGSRPEILPMIYTVIKELTINACKANQKRVFFEEKGYDIFNQEDYTKGIIEYKASFSESMGVEYGPKSKAKGYYCSIRFDYSDLGFIISISNNTPIAKPEEKAIREKLAMAMGYDDLAQFYMDNADNTEGAGLGLALIIIMLKGEGIDPNFFRIAIVDGVTTARLEVPLANNFKSKRQ